MHKRFIALLLKSTRIQAAIEYEQKRPRPDWMRLFRLKRLRVMLKDKLHDFLNPAPQQQLVPIRLQAARQQQPRGR